MTEGIELARPKGDTHGTAKELEFRENFTRTTRRSGYSATGGES